MVDGIGRRCRFRSVWPPLLDPGSRRPCTVLLSVGVATFVFSASPFLIDAVADHYDVRLATSALLGTNRPG